MDTSVAIHLRDGSEDVTRRVAARGGEPAISIVTHVELEGGVYRDPTQSAHRRLRLDNMLRTIEVIPFDRSSLNEYRSILAAAGFSRPKIIDRMIAAQALASRIPLVTLNARDFRDIPGLILEDWS